MTQARSDTSIFLAWLPLAAMWIIMAIEQPAVAAVIARMNESKNQLAAFGLTFSIALFIEGPVVQMLAAGTAAADSRENYRRLLNLMHLIGWSATGIHALLCLPPLFRAVAGGLIGVPESLIETSRLAFIAMLPWTLAVGYRRLMQGVLIRYGRSDVIPVTMVIRMTVSFATLAWGYLTGALPGAVLGALALSAGVIAGAVSAWFYVRPVTAALPSTRRGDAGAPKGVLSRRELAFFYIPLALTNFINLGARPLMQIGLARGLLPLESLAIWPVSIGYIFLYSSFALSSQEVVIARLDGPESRRGLTRFITGLSIVLGTLYLAVRFTPLWRLWFGGVSGLPEDLTALSALPVLLVFPVVPLYAYIALFRGALVRLRRTSEVTAAVSVNIVVLLTSMFAAVAWLPFPAITAVSAAFALAYTSEFLYLLSRRPLRAFRPASGAAA